MNDMHRGPLLAEDEGGRHVVDCRACGFAHIVPRPSDEELAGYYQRGFYETHSPPDWAEKEAREQEYWQIEYRDRLEVFERLKVTSDRRLLDVGCGAGWFLAHAASRSWDGLGIEPSEAMWKRAAKRASVVHGSLADFEPVELGRFDAVHVKLVLEHVRDPSEFLRAIDRVVTPGAIVCIEVPNDFNPLQFAVQRVLDKKPWWVSFPAHLNYFSFDSLEELLRRHGFEPLERFGTYPMEWFLLQGIDYVGRDDVGRRCHQQRMNLETNLEAAGLGDIRREFGSWLASRGIGREAVVYARKGTPE